MARIVLGVCGGAATYKACDFARLLIHANHDVRVVMSPEAERFVTPLTFGTLTKNKPVTTLFPKNPDDFTLTAHIGLAQWGDLCVVLPATANCIAKMAHGIADDALSTTLLAFDSAKTIVVPAMNERMLQTPGTQRNLATLQADGVREVSPITAELACGEMGKGHLASLESVMHVVEEQLHKGPLAGKRITITSGPTQEFIDPVRFISNRSSGKMGVAISQAALNAGAEVTLISGPVSVAPPAGAQVIDVVSANEMLEAARFAAKDSHVFISVAAVCDQRPKERAESKLKKGSTLTSTLDLVENPDIVKTIAQEFPEVLCVGFAAETGADLNKAHPKREEKGLGLLMVTEVGGEESAFDASSAHISIQTSSNIEVLSDTKEAIAKRIIEHVIEDLREER